MKMCNSISLKTIMIALLAILAFGISSASAKVIEGDGALVRLSIMFGDADGAPSTPLTFSAVAHNDGEKDVTIQFPSSLQVDYVIDGNYKHSTGKAFLTAITEVVIPAGGEYVWEFIHDEEEYPLKPGEHSIYAEIVGTDIHAKDALYVSPYMKPLPEGIELTVSTGNTTHDPGDKITFTLAAKNETNAAIDIHTIESRPIQYRLVKLNQGSSDPDSSIIYWDSIYIDSMIHEYTDTTIPAGGELTWTHAIAEKRLLLGGDYTLLAGLRNYTDLASVDITVTDKEVKGAISGTVVNYDEFRYINEDSGQSGNPDIIKPETLAGATVTLRRIDGEVTILDDGTEFGNRKTAEDTPELTTTDDDGRFSFTDVTLGQTYEIKVVKEEYFDHSMVIHPSMAVTELNIPLSFDPSQAIKPLPDGIELTVTPERNIIDPGDEIIFTLTATNTTVADIELQVIEENPLQYQVIRTTNGTDSVTVIRNNMHFDYRRHQCTSVILPAGGTKSWKQNMLEEILLFGGDYTISTGLRNYSDLASAPFTISNMNLAGTISGLVTSFSDDVFLDDPTLSFNESPDMPIPGAPLDNAVVTLTQLMEPTENLLRDTNNGMPVVHKKTGEEPSWRITTGEDGRFSFADIPLNYMYEISVAKEKYLYYAMIICPYSRENEYVIPLVLKRETPPLPVGNSVTTILGPVSATFSTGRYVFTQDGYIKGLYRIDNISETPVEFTFDTDKRVGWSILDPKDGRNLLTTETPADSTYPGNTVTVNPGESIEYHTVIELPDIVNTIENTDAVELDLKAVLLCSGASFNTFAPIDFSLTLPIVIVNSPSEHIDIAPNNTTYNVDCRGTLDTEIDITFKSSDCKGSLNITEIDSNIHAEFDKHTFLKMVAVDADDIIRRGMKNARIRIYFDPESCDRPENLVIAHWKESGDDDNTSESKTWITLPTEVNTTEGYAEAITPGFSSFGLFETEKTTAVDDDTPVSFSLGQNSPNPFNPVTSISFSIPSTGHVTLTVYNISGQMVEQLIDHRMQAGSHQVVFDASRLSSGVYIYKLATTGYISTKRMLLLK